MEESLSAPPEFQPLEDEWGRRFPLKRDGQLFYHIPDGRWKPAVPVEQQSIHALAEADALFERGSCTEAYLIWKAILAARQSMRYPPAFLLKAAAVASGRVNDTTAKGERFVVCRQEADPFALFIKSQARTLLVSEKNGWKLSLPGSWRWIPSHIARTFYPGNSRSGGSTTLLSHNDFILAIQIIPATGSGKKALTLEEFMSRWDYGAGLIGSRNKKNSPERSPVAALDTWIGGGKSGWKGAVFKTSFKGQKAGPILEVFLNSSDGGLRMAFYFPSELAADAERIMAYILKEMELY